MKLILTHLSSLLFVLILCNQTLASEGVGSFLGGGPGFPFTDPDHVVKDPFKKDYFRVGACSIVRDGKKWALNEAAGSYQKAFEIIAMTPSGQHLLAEFNAQNEKTPYSYVELYTEVRRRMGFPTKVGAAYVFDGKSQTIYYDPQDDLGLLAVFLSHELTHAIDPDVPKTYFEETDAWKSLKPEEFAKLRQQNSFRIERRAFDMQDKIYPELMALTGCYENFIQQHRDGEDLKLFNPTPDSFIKSAYGIP
jgi:hypothetical protein